jgi:toxin-antitoxin system PIN domain toxin
VIIAVLLPDLNVLINAHRTDSPAHAAARDWLRSAFAGEEALGLCAPVLMGLIRVLTHPRVFDPPDTLEQAFAFVDALTGHPNAVVLNPGRDHLRLFRDLCVSAETRGDLVADAYLAALAAETGATLVSADRHFERFPGVRWLRP